ncbi:hypothetical protein CALCODRAFT_437100 [Calocera cornea HHB12733]|uniref:Antifreeze protein n=1 Tax=Calocera cornea HHB12733 TaxID=1353952 RepID=A0A165ETN0_9BASI|nr:hypothetical protein CALCODRAFT_437100 [Calocera cornea HHB12733]
MSIVCHFFPCQRSSPSSKPAFQFLLVQLAEHIHIQLYGRSDNAVVVPLGTAMGYTILAQSGITTTPTGPSSIEGNIGVYPIDSTAITGFALILDPSGIFSTSTQVSGDVFAHDYNPPTPANLLAATNFVSAAYGFAAGEVPPDHVDLGNGHIGGMTLLPGIYKFSMNTDIDTDLTLTGACSDVYVFQISGTLTQAANTNIILSGGISPSRIFWQVTDTVQIGANANFQGIILAATDVALVTGAALTGRIFAGTNVALDQNIITEPQTVDPATCLVAVGEHTRGLKSTLRPED